jgi:hypothetical protein
MWDEHGLGLQPQSPHFTITYWLGVAQISSKIPKAWSAWAAITWWGHIHMHIHSNECCQIPCLCMILMWDEYDLGLQPQSPHFTMGYWLGVAKISSKIPKAWSAWAAVTWWGHTHIYPSAHPHCQTPCICMALMWDEYGLGLQPQSPHFTMGYWLGVTQNSSKIPKAWSAWAALRIKTSPLACTTLSFEGCQTPSLCLLRMWEQSWVGFSASTTTSSAIHWCPEVTPEILLVTSKSLIWLIMVRVAVMWQRHIHMHIHIIWHLLCVWYGCGNNFEWVYSLNQYTFLSQLVPES